MEQVIAEFKSSIRGARSKTIAFDKFRSKLDEELLPMLYDWIKTQHEIHFSGPDLTTKKAGKIPIICGDLVRSYSSIWRTRDLEPQNLRIEVACLVARLFSSAFDFQKLSHSIEQITECIFREDWRGAKELLDKHTQEFGVSCYSLEIDFLLLSKSENGSEAQKNLRSQLLQDTNIPQNVRFLISFISQKLEPSANFLKIRDRLFEATEEVSDTNIPATLNYFLLRELPVSEQDVAGLICGLQKFPVVDSYICLQQLLRYRFRQIGPLIGRIDQFISRIHCNAKLTKMLLAMDEVGQVDTPQAFVRAVCVYFEVRSSPPDSDRVDFCGILECISKIKEVSPTNTRWPGWPLPLDKQSQYHDALSCKSIASQRFERSVEFDLLEKSFDPSSNSYLQFLYAFRNSTRNLLFLEEVDETVDNEITLSELVILFHLSPLVASGHVERHWKRITESIVFHEKGEYAFFMRLSFLHLALRARDLKRVRRIISSISHPVMLEPLIVAEGRTLLDAGNIEAAFQSVSNYSVMHSTPRLIRDLMGPHLDELTWAKIKGWPDQLSIAIGLNLIGAHICGEVQNSAKRFATLTYLRGNGVQKPSELKIAECNEDPRKVVYFLREVCTQDIYPKMPFVSKDVTSQIEERLAVIQNLISYSKSADEVAELQTEMSELFSQLKFRQARSAVTRTRLYLDEPKLIGASSTYMKEDFNRYRFLSDKEATTQEGEDRSFKLLKKFLRKELEISDITFKAEHESDTVLIALIGDFVDHFLTQERFGFNQCLSARIRHGSFENPFQSVFRETGFWLAEGDDVLRILEKYASFNISLSPVQLIDIEAVLKDFSKNISLKLEEIRTKNLQIKSKVIPTGYFEVAFGAGDYHGIRLLALSSPDFSSWAGHVINFIWQNLEKTFQEVRKKLDLDFRDRVLADLSLLEERIGKIIDCSEDVGKLENQIAIARTKFNDVYSDISNWFRRPTAEAAPKYSLNELTSLAEQLFNRFYEKSNIRYHYTLDDTEVRLSSFSSFYHIYLIVIGNAWKYRPRHRDSTVEIALSMDKPGLINMNVRNEVEDGCEQEILRKCNEAKEIIAAERWDLKLSDEGGTGFIKLASMLAESGEPLEFGINSDGLFEVNFHFEALGV